MAQKAIGLRLEEDLLARIDAARGDVPRARWIVRAIETRLAQPSAEMMVGRLVGQGILSPAERPERPNLRGAYEVAAKGGVVGELFQAAADSVAAKPAPRQHAENCKCPVCS